MGALTAALAVGIGIHLALTLFLLLRYVEGRERLIGWWGLAYAFFTAHVAIEALLTVYPTAPLFALRHALFILAAWAMVYSFRPDPRVTAVAAAATALAVWLALAVWTAGAIAASLAGAAGFVRSANLLRRREGGLQATSTTLMFWGLLLGGLHSLDYPLLRPHPVPAAVGAGLSGLLTIIFGIGVVLWALERSRDLVTLSLIAEALNRSLDVRTVLGQALHQVLGLTQLPRGWILLRGDGDFRVAAAENLPDELVADNMAAMRGDCRCLQMLREGQLTKAVNLVTCLRLERAGWAHPCHATVPLTTGNHVLGVMNLVLPGQRVLAPRELATLSAVGSQIGLAVERARLYDEVSTKEAARGELLEKLITAHEDERRRIARELHDEAGQALTALILNLQMAEQSPRRIEQQNLGRLRGIAEHTLGELRRIISALRPTILDDLGLGAAIRWYVKEMVEPQGLRVTLQLSGLDVRMPHLVETAVFRIVQEAFTNILKHARAREARVEAQLRNGQVRVTIADDGTGFEVDSVPRARAGRGMGLLGMRERAELLAGSLQVSSRPGAGTVIEVVIPVEHGDGQD